MTVNFTFPQSGKAYVNIHLDYGVKGQMTDRNPVDGSGDRYDNDATSANPGTLYPCVGNAAYSDALQNDSSAPPAGPLALATCTTYPFSYSHGLITGSDSIQNVNTFKKIAGAFGQAVSQGTGGLYAGVAAKLSDSTGKVLATATTDKDGFYSLPYKQTGKAALFTITLGTGATAASKVVELHANGWTEADYDPLTLTWYVSVK